MSSASAAFVGLDLGNTWTRLAARDALGQPLPTSTGVVGWSLPSLLAFEGDEILTGSEAQKLARARPETVVGELRSRLGRPGITHQHHERSYSAIELTALLLSRLREIAEADLACPLGDVVVTVPASSDDNHRVAVKEAAERAGLTVRTLLPTPLAIALSYGLHLQADQTALIVDLGGTSFETSLVQVRNRKLSILARGGDAGLGGQDWDHALLPHLAHAHQELTGNPEDPFRDEWVRWDALAELEAARIRLSQRQKALVVAGRVEVPLTRQQTEDLTAPLLERALSLVRGTMLGVSRVDRVLLAGGATLMPALRYRLQQEFGVVEYDDPETAAVRGAAQFGWMRFGKPVLDKVQPTMILPTVQPASNQMRLLSWRLERGLFRKAVNVVISGDLSGLASLRLVGQVNETPATPEDGQTLAQWVSGTAPPGKEIRLPLEGWSGQRGEVYCSLFVAPEQNFIIESPISSERIAWSK